MLSAGLLDSASFERIAPMEISANTGEKPQSKVWCHDDTWWSVLPNKSGTFLWRLDGAAWSPVLKLSQNTAVRADVEPNGDLAHVLLYCGRSSELVTAEYVPGEVGTYQFWSTQRDTVDVALSSGVETATIELDSTGRLWLASDAKSTVEVRYSDYPYYSFSSPITIASGIHSDDISCVTSLGNGSIGVLWSNQNAKRFGFRVHQDGDAPGQWTANEVPASQSARSVGGGMADDHLNCAVASDGTLYAAVKTSYDQSGQPRVGLLVRRPSGEWDPLYNVDTSGTRAIVMLNEEANRLIVAYTATEGGGNILYRESPMDVIAFGARKTLISGTVNNVSSTEQPFTDELVVIAAGGSSARGTRVVIARPPEPEPEPIPSPLYEVSPDGTELVVHGTDEDDAFEVELGPPRVAAINGVRYDFSEFPSLSSLSFLGEGGADTLSLMGTGANESAVLYPGTGSFIGPGYEVHLSDIESVTLDGGGGTDVAQLYDNPGAKDTFRATSTYARLYGDGFVNQVVSFAQVHAHSAKGEADVAVLWDSASPDVFEAAPDYATLKYGGSDDWFVRAVGFRYAYAYASTPEGGLDAAYLTDSATTKDRFVGTPGDSKLYGPGFYVRANGFEQVTATATAGGGYGDVAALYDSASPDVFEAAPDYATLKYDGSDDRFVRAVGFRYAYAYASTPEGGLDAAYLIDSPATEDRFVGTPGDSKLYNADFYLRANGFEQVTATATAGGGYGDVAKLYDSAGSDTFEGMPDHGKLEYGGEEHFVQAIGFRYLYAFALAVDAPGSIDVATLHDSSLDDVLVVTPTYTKLYNPSEFYHRVACFDEVTAWATDRVLKDRVYFSDSPSSDHLEAVGDLAEFRMPGQVIKAYQFTQVRAESCRSGTDTKHEEALRYVLETTGPWIDV